jgi:hypothetical protein
MKKSLLIKLHLYCGLFTCFYLLAFGVSSIILNHKIEVENTAVKKTWTDQVVIDQTLDDNGLAKSVRDQLDIMGWPPTWQFKRDSNTFQMNVTQLAKTSKLEVDLNSGAVKVDEIPKGFLATLHGLHFFNGRIPNAPFFLKTWIVYQWLALFVFLISLVLGLWLWLKYSYKPWELIVFGGLFIFSCLLMLLL